MTVQVWDLATGAALKTFTTEHEGWLAYKSQASEDGILRISQAAYDSLIPEYREALVEK